MVARGPDNAVGTASTVVLYDAVDFERTRGSVAARLFGRTPSSTKLGRFIVEGNAGAGQMGRVYLARDPELDRRVAIKVLHADGDSDRARDREERLRREARALAKLSDPHVVTVYEVGRHGGALFIVMELLEGITLRRWLEQPRDSAQVVSVLADAGRGLAAAHRAGVLHRDFKPANAMIREDGRVVVLDFGLSRRGAEATPSEDDVAPPEASLTAVGMVVGSPAYLAPEVLRGEEATERSDQFSFCVTLYEALHGVRPFEGAAGRAFAPPDLDALPRPRRVPDWLHAVIVRGLGDDPASRHDSMDALVVELTRRRLTPGRALAGGVGILALLGAGAGLAVVLDSDLDEPCRATAARLDVAWSESIRGQLGAALETGASAAVAERTDAGLDGYAAAWAEAQRAACRDTHVDHTRSERTLDLRSACLAARLDEFEALVEVLAESKPEVQRLAPAAVDRLPALAPCFDDNHLEATVPPPDEGGRTARVAELRQRLAQANALIAAGRYGDAETLAGAVQTEADAVDYAPVAAEASLAWGLAAHRLQRSDAERQLRDAVNLAEAAAHDRVSLQGWRLLVWASAQTERASLALERAEALTTRLGASERDREALATARGHLASRRAEYSQAVEHFSAALQSARARGLPGEIKAAEYLLSLTQATAAAGDYDDALRWAAQAESALVAAYGEPHPLVGRARSNRAVLTMHAGRPEQAVPIAQSAAAMQREALGPDHPDVATAVLGLGAMLYTLGRLDEALTSFEEATRIRSAAHGLAAPDLAGPLGNTARVLLDLDRDDEATTQARRAVEILERAGATERPAFTVTLATLADCLRATGELQAAVETLRRVLAIEVQRFSPEHREAALTRIRLADVLREAGSVEEASDLARVGVAQLRKAHEGRDHRELANALLALGRVTRAGGAPEAARPIFEEALAIARRSEGADDLVDDLETALRD